jgi:flagellar hook-basal body complex protein FliE
MIEPVANNLNLNLPDNLQLKLDNNEGLSFTELLKESILRVNQMQEDADKITRDFALGKIDNIHQVTIATEKARLALNLTLAIQNKVVNAYKEVMRMQL